jgi:hypothetical protein
MVKHDGDDGRLWGFFYTGIQASTRTRTRTYDLSLDSLAFCRVRYLPVPIRSFVAYCIPVLSMVASGVFSVPPFILVAFLT